MKGLVTIAQSFWVFGFLVIAAVIFILSLIVYIQGLFSGGSSEFTITLAQVEAIPFHIGEVLARTQVDTRQFFEHVLELSIGKSKRAAGSDMSDFGEILRRYESSASIRRIGQYVITVPKNENEDILVTYNTRVVRECEAANNGQTPICCEAGTPEGRVERKCGANMEGTCVYLGVDVVGDTISVCDPGRVTIPDVNGRCAEQGRVCCVEDREQYVRRGGTYDIVTCGEQLGASGICTTQISRQPGDPCPYGRKIVESYVEEEFTGEKIEIPLFYKELPVTHLEIGVEP